MPVKMTKLEERAIKLLMKYEGKGILQSELWHKLGVTSREGSRIGIKLEKKGVVKRVREFANDRWTRRLVPLIKQIDVQVLNGVPCPSCIYDGVCGPNGEKYYASCPLIEEWVLKHAECKENENDSRE
ncbi:MAG: Lrp/AsnC family transcriptional regulator [Aigarchaeota archaeon]|nr:Lrp/AsnC family transcriptional regulator [Candidatus Pelearchaeum maunauluense]